VAPCRAKLLMPGSPTTTRVVAFGGKWDLPLMRASEESIPPRRHRDERITHSKTAAEGIIKTPQPPGVSDPFFSLGAATPTVGQTQG